MERAELLGRLEAAEADEKRWRDLYETRSEYVEVLEEERAELRAEVERLRRPEVVCEAFEGLMDADRKDCVVRIDVVLGGGIRLHTLMRRSVGGATLAKAFAKLTGGRDAE